jgi:hypothetical protein
VQLQSRGKVAAKQLQSRGKVAAKQLQSRGKVAATSRQSRGNIVAMSWQCRGNVVTKRAANVRQTCGNDAAKTRQKARQKCIKVAANLPGHPWHIFSIGLQPHLLPLFHTDTSWHSPVFSCLVALMRSSKKSTVI